jgi:hypothetical protein
MAEAGIEVPPGVTTYMAAAEPVEVHSPEVTLGEEGVDGGATIGGRRSRPRCA